MPCPYCNHSIDATAYFCPNCGKKVREKPVSAAFSEQLSLYALSILAPPFFIGRTWRYLRSPDPQAKTVGLLSLVFTIIALVVATWTTYVFIQNINTQVDDAMQKYQNIGY